VGLLTRTGKRSLRLQKSRERCETNRYSGARRPSQSAASLDADAPNRKRSRALELLGRWPDGSSEWRDSTPARPWPIYRGCCWVLRISVKSWPARFPSKAPPACELSRMRSLYDRAAAAPECRQYWQRACELILAHADIMEVSRQLELVLFRDATLDLVALYADA
jgi:hypothetical protein